MPSKKTAKISLELVNQYLIDDPNNTLTKVLAKVFQQYYFPELYTLL